MKKKILLVGLLVVLVAAVSVGLTVAYLTSQDSETNTFTVGDVKIDLIESQYHRVNAGKGDATGETEPICGGYLWAADVHLTNDRTAVSDDNYKWTGSFFSDEQIKDDAATYKEEYFAKHSQNMVPGSNVRKNPYVVNKGKNDAYVRVRVLVPETLFYVIDKGSSYWTTTAMDEGAVTSKAVAYYLSNNGQPDPSTIVTRENAEGEKIQYYEFDFTYTKALKAGAMTFWNVWGNIAIDKNATAAQLENVESFDVIFEADAIQADGFADATAAFAAFDK